MLRLDNGFTLPERVCRMSEYRIRGVWLAGALLLAGCSDPQRDLEGSWYDQSRQANEIREGYVAQQEQFGVQEVDAKKSYDGQMMIERTHGRRGVTVAGDELREMISP
jgi:hypothetical protein